MDLQSADLQAALPRTENVQGALRTLPHSSRKTTLPFHLSNHLVEDDSAHRQAELFYLQKQIQTQTPMVIVLADGEHIEGCIEWYDRRALKVRGRSKVLIYKSAIKYMYKLGENAQ